MVTVPVRFEFPGQWQIVADVDLTESQSSTLEHIIKVLTYTSFACLTSRCCGPLHWRIQTPPEMELGQWVMGQMGHHFWMGHVGRGSHSQPVTH